MSGNLALSRAALEHRRGPASVSDCLKEALFVRVFLPNNRIAIPMLVQVS